MLTEIFGDYPQVRVVDLLISHPLSEYTKTDIAEGANIGRPTLYKFFEKLERYDLIKPIRKIGNTQLYQVNTDSPVIMAINKFQMHLADIEADIQVNAWDGDQPNDDDIEHALQELSRENPDKKSQKHKKNEIQTAISK